MTAVDPIVVEVGSAPITVTVASTGLVLSVATGTVGPAGAAGATGQGVPTGGTTGQVLAKKSGTNYDTEWVAQSGGGGGSGTVTSVTGTAPISVATGTTTPVVSIAAATTSTAGSMSASDKSKLDGVASGATANSSDATLLARANHTGMQTLSTISDAGTAAAKNVPATGNASATEVVLGSDTRLTDTRTPTDNSVTSAKIVDGTIVNADISASAAIATSKISGLSTVATSGAYTDLSGRPTLGTSSSKDVPASGNASSTQVVLGSDTRLTGERVPYYPRTTWTGAANLDLSGQVSSTRWIQQTGTVSAARTVTLPPVADMAIGDEIIVQSGAGVSTTNTVTILPASGELINGSSSGVAIGTPYGWRRFITDGTGWTFDAGVVRTSNNLSDLGSASTARTNLGLGSLATLSTITSSEITDGTIVNADISASAAIATSKISGLATVATSGSASDLSAGTVPSARLSTKAVGGQGAGSGVAVTTSAASILSSTITLPACAAGDLVIVTGSVSIFNNSTASRTYTAAIKLGATTVGSVASSGQTNNTTRVYAFQAYVRVNGTSDESVSFVLTSGTVGVTASGVATENIGSGSLALDVVVSSAASTATQTATLDFVQVTKVAA